jgi:AmmeMemoRadiSam system protein B/AmmeMemoRadiSam system protein A
MSKKFLSISIGLLFIVSLASSQEIKRSLLAGSWYPKDPDMLSKQINGFLQYVKPPALSSDKILALIVPHAGYAYSGQVAASAYRLVQGKNYDTVVILAPSHRFGFEGCSIYKRGGYQTPLGIAPIDESLAEEISKATHFSYIAQAHQEEHAVEIQVPFIQTVLPGAKIVPIVVGYPRRNTIERLAAGLKKALPGKNVLLIASTDLSHFLSKEQANKKDHETISLIQDFKTSTLQRECEAGENIMCGGGPVVATLLYAQDKAQVEILSYSDSSHNGGDESRVVGYLAAALVAKSSDQAFSLSEKEKKELVRLAYATIRQYVRVKKLPEYSAEGPHLRQNRGAFVTLTEHGSLRGCIGFTEPLMPLYQTVMEAAVYAACRDPRFRPVTPDELDDLAVEISVLTPLEKILDPRSVIIGKHGLVIEMNGKRGLLLPQVATENRWNQTTFLEQACLKAGLPKTAWKSGANIYVFEAIVFH